MKGVYLPENKDSTKTAPIIEIEPGDELIYPLAQHYGRAAVPAVQAGERVKAGQIIAAADGKISANIHASVSGKISKITYHFAPNGKKVQSIFLENDGLYRAVSNQKQQKPENLSPNDITDIAFQSGIVGMGGAGFPMHAKMTVAKSKNVDTVIVNGAECEPYITGDYRIMLEEPEDVVSGAKAVAKAVGAKRIIIAIKESCAHELQPLANDEGIEIALLPGKYPQGSEKQLIKRVLGREAAGLPTDVGVTVHNAASCAALAQAIKTGMPLTCRIVTAAGGGIAKPGNFRVPIGTKVEDFIKATGGLCSTPSRLILGGPMMGAMAVSADMPITKTTTAVLALTESELGKDDGEGVCLRCGRCVEVCPMGLMPLTIATLAKAGRIDECIDKYGSRLCIECGCCSYICPGGYDPVQYIRLAKNRPAKGKGGGR